MTPGQLLQTRVDAANPQRVYYGYDQPGGRAISNTGAQLTVGQYLDEVQSGGLFGIGTTRWYHIQLTQPLTNGGKTYAQLWMRADDLTVSQVTPVSVWATLTGAIVYQRAAKTSAQLQRRSAAQFIGTTEGTYNGEFIYVKLAVPVNGYTYGYVLRSQLSTQDPTVISNDPAPALESGSTGWLARAVGQPLANSLQSALLLVLIGLAGYAAYRFIKHRDDR